MSTPDLIKYDIGSFTLRVQGQGQFAVQSFQLAKQVGKLGSCTVRISDCTQTVSINPSSYPKKLGSIKALFNQTQKIQNIGTLLDVALIEYNSVSGTRTWFIGKLCTVAPALQSTYGVYAGLTCFCLSKACQLMYSPIADFIYVPAQMATQVENLRSAGVFDKKIVQATYAASNKNLAQDIAAQVPATDNILQILDTVLKKSLQREGTRSQILGKNGDINLGDYFQCDLKLSDLVTKICRDTQHPYVQQLVKDLYNGFQQVSILDSITGALLSRQRYLTYIPASISQAKRGYDKIKIWPSYIEAERGGMRHLSAAQMLSCTISSDPLQHLRTPTLLFVRAEKASAWKAQKDSKQQEYQDYMGNYILPGAKAPYRFQVLDIPSWVYNAIMQAEARNIQDTKPALLNNKKLREIKGPKKTKQPEQQIVKLNKDLLDQVAKTRFLHTYMLTKYAQITLAVTQDTVGIDDSIGHSICVTLPVQADQLGGDGQQFYGRLQDVRYKFNAAQSPRAKSTLNITCSLSGVTAAKSPAAAIYTDDDPFFIYKRG